MQIDKGNEMDAVLPTSPNPWFLWHGIFFIITFSLLMPVATYLILVNKERFYETHNILGVIILVLLVLGWACLAQGVSINDGGVGYLMENMSPVGISHSVTGIIAKYVALAVCLSGVLLRVLRMPKRVRFFVRVAHGVVGVAIAVMGIFVVWNGWVRIGITYNSVLDSSPIIWALGLVGFSMAYMWHIYDTKWRRKAADTTVAADQTKETDIENTTTPANAACMSFGEMVEIVKEARFFVFNKTEVIVLDEDFVHPGGMGVLEPFLGRDITMVFAGQETFVDSETNATRMWSHSAQALERLRSMRVGVLEADGGSTEVGRGEQLSMELFDESEKSVGIITATEKANETGDCIKMTVKVVDVLLFSVIEVGTKLKLSMSYELAAIERTYTVADIVTSERTVVFYVKVYPQGELTPLLNNLEVNDIVFISGRASPIPLPSPSKDVLLVCAGTGIVPMLPYINAVLADENLETCKKCTVLWWIRNQQELFFMERMNDILNHEKAEDRINSVQLHFTANDEHNTLPENMHKKITVSSGRISCDILQNFFNTKDPVTVVMSGPSGFTNAATTISNSLMVEGSVLINLD